GSAAPSWVNPSTLLTTTSIVPSASSVVVVNNGTNQTIGSGNPTLDVQGNNANQGGVLYSTGTGNSALFNGTGTAGQILSSTGSGAPQWKSANLLGLGTVTSVGLSLPAGVFTVSGSPVTTSGTLTGTFNTQNANT